MDWENKRRDRQQGVHIDPEDVDKKNIEIPVDADNDSTDWENKSLRYILQQNKRLVIFGKQHGYDELNKDDLKQ